MAFESSHKYLNILNCIFTELYIITFIIIIFTETET